MQLVLFLSVLAGFLGICNGISMGNVVAAKIDNSEYHLSTTNIEKQVASTINNPGIQSVDSQTAIDIQNTQNNGKRHSKRISMGSVTAGTVENSEYHISAQNVGTQVAGSINNPGIKSVDSQTAIDIQNTQKNGKRYTKRISMGAVTAGIVKNSEYHIKAQNVGTQVAGSINNPGIQSVDSQTAVDIQNTQNNGKRSVIQLRNLMSIKTQNAVNIKNFQTNSDNSKPSPQGEFNVGTMNAVKDVSFSSN